HLQDDLELVADVVRRERVERPRAVAGLQHEAAPFGHRRERVAEAARLAREHERWHRAQRRQRSLERGRVGPLGLLLRGERSPAVGRPVLHGKQLALGRLRAGGGHRYPLGPTGPGGWPCSSAARRRICSSWPWAIACCVNSVAWIPWKSPSSQPTS